MIDKNVAIITRRYESFMAVRRTNSDAPVARLAKNGVGADSGTFSCFTKAHESPSKHQRFSRGVAPLATIVDQIMQLFHESIFLHTVYPLFLHHTWRT
jgi:hypothetical protein